MLEPSYVREPERCTRALANYATFRDLLPENVSVARVAKTFGGISGWASLTEEISKEASFQTSAEPVRRSPVCAFKLTRVLRATRFKHGLEKLALSNFMKFHRRSSDGREATVAEVEATLPGVLGWAMPTFSCAKENYETFKNMEPGAADLKDVILSSAGIFGWASCQSQHRRQSPSASSLPLNRGRSFSNLSSEDSTEDSETVRSATDELQLEP